MNKNDKSQEYEKVLSYIVQEIKDGKLIAGSKIQSERELSEILGTSRSSTREAISILRGMGIAESRLGSGNYLVNNSDKTIKKIVEIMLATGSTTVKELIDYRKAISRAVGAELVENGMSLEYEKKITDILDKMRTATDEEFCHLDREFHLSLINATENRLFTTVMEPVGELYLDMIVTVIMMSTDEERSKRTTWHEDIFNSIKNRDYVACIAAMKAHYDYVESKF